MALCTRLLRGPVKDTVLVRSLRIGAGFVGIAGFLGQYLQVVAGHLAAEEALQWHSSTTTTSGRSSEVDLNDMIGVPLPDTLSWRWSWHPR
ncbi:MAG: hypothetical protein L0H93_02720 [Nocardioides sp.]|nr:hypothetical protein [Nocardioides sp.]